MFFYRSRLLGDSTRIFHRPATFLVPTGNLATAKFQPCISSTCNRVTNTNWPKVNQLVFYNCGWGFELGNPNPASGQGATWTWSTITTQPPCLQTAVTKKWQSSRPRFKSPKVYLEPCKASSSLHLCIPFSGVFFTALFVFGIWVIRLWERWPLSDFTGYMCLLSINMYCSFSPLYITDYFVQPVS